MLSAQQIDEAEIVELYRVLKNAVSKAKVGMRLYFSQNPTLNDQNTEMFAQVQAEHLLMCQFLGVNPADTQDNVRNTIVTLEHDLAMLGQDVPHMQSKDEEITDEVIFQFLQKGSAEQ